MDLIGSGSKGFQKIESGSGKQMRVKVSATVRLTHAGEGMLVAPSAASKQRPLNPGKLVRCSYCCEIRSGGVINAGADKQLQKIAAAIEAMNE